MMELDDFEKLKKVKDDLETLKELGDSLHNLINCMKDEDVRELCKIKLHRAVNYSRDKIKRNG